MTTEFPATKAPRLALEQSNDITRCDQWIRQDRQNDTSRFRRTATRRHGNCAINSPGAIEASAHLYEFDSVHGRSHGTVSHGADWMDVGRGKIHMSRERNPADIPHADHGIDIVLECSGKFNERQRCLAHLDAGAKRVLVSAPAKTRTRPSFMASTIIRFIRNAGRLQRIMHDKLSGTRCHGNGRIGWH